VRVNGWTDVSIFPCGLSDQTALLLLHVSGKKATDALGSFLPDVRPELDLDRTKYAAVFNYADIDTFIEEPIALLKIDVEGAELEIVRGMAAAIRRDRPIVVIELLPIATLTARHEETVALLQSLDYDIFSIKRNPRRHWIGLQPVDSFLCPDNPEISEYLAIPREKQAFLDGAPGQS
jgi:FkbM family methyltransferase